MKPTTPQCEAGFLIEPPVSEPILTSTKPAATDAAEPEDEPPGCIAANGYRLPTEAEWEYACRAGTTTAYFFGDDASKLKAYAWFEDNSGGKPRPVGQKPANPWDLYDMHGNIWEWCNDFYKVDYYQESPGENPRGPETGETRVLRGGAWKFSAESCSSAYRYNENPGYADVCFGYDIYGFRCVRNAPTATLPE